MTRMALAWTVRLGALAALAGLIPADAGAGQYACQVPLAVLCPGCAAAVTIALDPRGGCRVSFTPAPGAASSSVSGVVTLQIETPPPAPPRRGVYSRARHAARPLQSSRGACFLFNGHQYCE